MSQPKILDVLGMSGAPRTFCGRVPDRPVGRRLPLL
jgi:hypothetical protein